MKIRDFELTQIFFKDKKIDINALYQSSGRAYIKENENSSKEETALRMTVEEKSRNC